MPWRRHSSGSFNPTGALFAVIAFSCSDGKRPSEARRKTGRTDGRSVLEVSVLAWAFLKLLPVDGNRSAGSAKFGQHPH